MKIDRGHLMFYPLQMLCLLLAASVFAENSHTYTWKNNIPPRYQWNSNSGYCGEVSLISAGLYYGQYLSQYDARAAAIENRPQNEGQLLLGKNDKRAASKMRLNAIEWDTASEQRTPQFLAWVKQQVVKGYPVAIGIYTNEYLFYQKSNPHAGDAEYDHIVPVTGIGSNHPLSDPNYYSDDLLSFSDNGLWGNYPIYHFSYAFGAFQASRRKANAMRGAIYSLSNSGSSYGIAITGVVDLNGDTLPVQVMTGANYEAPPIKNKSSQRPKAMPLELTVIVSNLESDVLYHLYRYNNLEAVPDSQFNARAGQACQMWPIQISPQIPSCNTYTLTQQIQSDEIAVYRCVKATAP